jgi:hypothetical protein
VQHRVQALQPAQDRVGHLNRRQLLTLYLAGERDRVHPADLIRVGHRDRPPSGSEDTISEPLPTWPDKPVISK